MSENGPRWEDGDSIVSTDHRYLQCIVLDPICRFVESSQSADRGLMDLVVKQRPTARTQNYACLAHTEYLPLTYYYHNSRGSIGIVVEINAGDIAGYIHVPAKVPVASTG